MLHWKGLWMTVQGVIRTGRYYDSVTLMGVAREIRHQEGIADAALMMGTAANKALLQQAGLYPQEVQSAAANDLIVVARGRDVAVTEVLMELDDYLTKSVRIDIESGPQRPHTLRRALKAYEGSNLVVVSVAGQYATNEAWQALRAGRHVLLFSDNVPVEEEIALKEYAAAEGLLLMGPGAGTAILNGCALGFANVVRRGSIGIVSAAGTGLQEVSSLISRHGAGISQGIGVGGRDLSDAVGGRMTRLALQALQADPATDVLVLISKIPSPTVVQSLLQEIQQSAKPVVLIFMGVIDRLQLAAAEHLYQAHTLQEAALMAVTLQQGQDLGTIGPEIQAQQATICEYASQLQERLSANQIFARGLFSGGTLCEESMQIWQQRLGPVWSNAPLLPAQQLEDALQSKEHCALDLGEEEFTQGRPHPMIDHDLRIRRLLQEAADPQVAVIQMDVVLGYGAHMDPAAELAPVIARIRRQSSSDRQPPMIVVSVTGTDGDPQDYSRQQQMLAAAGAEVMDSNASAALLSCMLVGKQ